MADDVTRAFDVKTVSPMVLLPVTMMSLLMVVLPDMTMLPATRVLFVTRTVPRVVVPGLTMVPVTRKFDTVPLPPTLRSEVREMAEP